MSTFRLSVFPPFSHYFLFLFGGIAIISYLSSIEGCEQDSGMTLVAVSRRGERICKAPREVVLQAGDTLLLIHPSPFGRTQLV